MAEPLPTRTQEQIMREALERIVSRWEGGHHPRGPRTLVAIAKDALRAASASPQEGEREADMRVRLIDAATLLSEVSILTQRRADVAIQKIHEVCPLPWLLRDRVSPKRMGGER